MRAVYKKELKCFFCTMTGYVFICLMLVIVGMYFTFTNVLGGNPYFSVSLQSALFVFLLAIPVLTMRSIAEERRQKTDQALLTSPNGAGGIVCGKYLAMVTVLLLPMLLFGVMPLIIRTLGTWYPKSDYAGLLMFFLIGCVYISAGLFVSSQTESQIVSAVGTFAVVLLLYLWEQLCDYLPYTPVSSLAGILALEALMLLVLRAASGKWKAPCLIFAVCAAVTAAFYAARPSAFAGLLRKALLKFSVTGGLGTVLKANALDLRAVFLALSMSGLFLFLTVQSVRQKTQSRKKARRSAMLEALLIAVFVSANLGVGALGSFMDIDLSKTDFYGISDLSRSFISQLDREVEIKLFSTEPDKRIVKFAGKYCEMSDRLSLELIDPVQHPDEASAVGASGDTAAVICPETGRTRLIPFSDIVQYDLLKYAYYGEYEETAFDADSSLTNAVNYVISDGGAVMCVIRGHGETELPERIVQEAEKTGFSLKKTDMLSDGGIPEDADVVVINAPKRDLAADEAEALGEFVSGGGNVVVLIGTDDGEERPNLQRLCLSFGIGLGRGVVRDEGAYYQNVHLIFPELDTAEEITRYIPVGDGKCLLYQARPLEKTEGGAARTLITTTETGAVENGGETGEKGRINLGLVCGGQQGSFMVLPASLIGETIIKNYGNVSNAELFMNAVTQYLPGVEALTIAPVELSSTYNASRSSSVCGVVFIAAIPGALLLAGLARWYVRRRR